MICPRCDRDSAYKVVDSPVGEEWSVFICEKCFYTWRSTEDEEITDPEKFDPRFKLTEESFEKMLCIPPIPPLKSGG
ncbi:hypothetical protein SAMN05660826_01995 [Caldanaerovirga acetigignens]|uniref:Phenolic acid decarboxylase subunit D n=1 Tax=Caldanaerovirga acetigignens TaxID=447595 RepID=A0A1M7LQ39_9FIRM|nr:non-oxidative hydroxyarylic acid decarboxylases subunit D [Caldanaerovirga acetigignens]SHM80217.1 hypothetical protein SAMN05660826_01995 [Caldanaerovirga acetigignens]